MQIHQLGPHNENEEKQLGPDPLIHPSSTVLNSEFGVYTEAGPHCFLKEICLGDYSYVSDSVRAIWAGIGKFTSIASHCVINPGNHPYDRVTQSHVTYRCRQYGFAREDDHDFFEWRKRDRAVIGNDVWLGHGVLVMPGARIADGAVVGAGSVVTKSHPIGPYEIAVGVPAKAVKTRFPKETIDRLLATAWWDWDRERLEQAFADLKDVRRFIEIHG